VRSIIVPVLICLTLLAPASALPDLSVPADAPAGARDRYIVGFYEMPDLERGDTYLGEPVVDVNKAIAFAVVQTDDYALFEARARLDENVRYIEWDNPAAGVLNYVPNDAQYNNAGHYGSKKIGAETAWDRTLGTTAVKMGIIDSGILKTHEEFATSGRVLQGYDFMNNDIDPDDTCGHGTHVAGTIGATINNAKGIAGMAQVQILMAKGLQLDFIGRCAGSTSGLANALTYMGDQGVHISSNSWSANGAVTSFNSAIDYSYGKGVTFVAAAGNTGGCTNCVQWPWKDRPDKVIVVSSTTSGDGFSSFSSEGPQIDVSAPGSSILSSYTGSNTAYATLSGTSMATPHVAGTAALLKTLHPSWGYSDIDSRLKTTAVDLGAAGYDQKFGYGRINAAAATAPIGPTAPGAPVLSGSKASGQVSLSWTTPANNGAAITGYKVYRDGTLRASLGVVNAYTDTGLTNGVAYAYTVKATNSVGDSAASNTVTLTPSPNQAPTACFSATTNSRTASVNGGCSSDPDGSIATYAWSWGDGSPAGSGATASHTYAADGTYTVTLTVTDAFGATATTSQSVSVANDPDPGSTNLQNGVSQTVTPGGANTDQWFKILVPSGKTQLQVVMDGAACGLLACAPNLDLYVKRGARPTDTVYDCRPFESDNDETCTHASPAADWWYVRVHAGTTSAAQYTIKATYTP
jgi:subtilisin family serine protease